MKTITLAIKGKYLQRIIKESKNIDIRAGYGRISKARVGDLITYSSSQGIFFRIIKIRAYTNFEEMLEKESFKFNAYADSKEEAREALSKLAKENRRKYNVYALEFEKVIEETITLKMSDSIKEKLKFGFVANEVFKGMMRDSKCNTIEFYHKYYQTIIPGVIRGNYNVFYADYKGLIISFMVITKTEEGAFVESIWSDMEYGEIYLDVLSSSLGFVDRTKPIKCDKKSPYVDIIREFYKNK